MGVVNLVLQSSLKMNLTMILRTANLRTVEATHLQKFVNLWFYNDFLRVWKWGFCNGILQSSLKTILGCFQTCFTMIF